MNKKIFSLFRVMMLAAIMAFGAVPCQAADEPISPEFAKEGVDKAIACLEDMILQLNAIETPEQAAQVQQITNSIEIRKIRKKYGKIVLTDEDKARFFTVNKEIAVAVMNMMSRLQAPMEVQQEFQKRMTDEEIQKEIDKAQTLRQMLE